MAEVVYQPAQRDSLHPRPDERDQLSREKQAIVAVAKRSKCAAPVEFCCHDPAGLRSCIDGNRGDARRPALTIVSGLFAGRWRIGCLHGKKYPIAGSAVPLRSLYRRIHIYFVARCLQLRPQFRQRHMGWNRQAHRQREHRSARDRRADGLRFEGLNVRAELI